jgi:DNA-binding response OmpR family regulator
MSQILLIEPDYRLGRIYKDTLEGHGHAVDLVNSAQTGVMSADNNKPNLVILELQLVEHSGIEFLYEFRSYNEWQAIPVIVHSHVPPGEFTGSWAVLTEELGVKEYMYKPRTSLRQLNSRVDSLLAIKA